MCIRFEFETRAVNNLCIGAFTVTSFVVSRGRLASLVGKRFVVVGLRVDFAGIQSLFAFNLLTHEIMILFYIAILLVRGRGLHWALCGRLVLFCYLPKKRKTRTNLVECVHTQWGRRSLKKSFKNHQPCFKAGPCVNNFEQTASRQSSFF